MRKHVVWIPTLLLALVAAPLGAQEVTCEDIAFDEQAVMAYPMVREACLDVIEHEGTRYAQLQARVRQAGPPSMLVMFKHRDGTYGPATRITPQADATAYLGGEVVRAIDVPAGSEMGIYLPEGRWEVAMSDAAELMIAEAEFAPLEMEVTAEEMPEGMPPEVEETSPMDAAADDAAADEAAVQEEGAPAEDGDTSEWYWILGLAAAFIIVWMMLRKKKAAREG